jgi:hypothetical protein
MKPDTQRLILNPAPPHGFKGRPRFYSQLNESLRSSPLMATPAFRQRLKSREEFRRSLIGRRSLESVEILLLHHNRVPDLDHRHRMPNQPSYFGEMTVAVIERKARHGKIVQPPKPANTASAKGKAAGGSGYGGSLASRPNRPGFDLSAEPTLKAKLEYSFNPG